MWDPNRMIDIGEWSTCGGGWLERCFFIRDESSRGEGVKKKIDS